MMGKAQRRQAKLFYTAVDLEERVPPDHRLRRIKAAVSFASVRPTVARCYGYNGHSSLDPVLVLKLMLLLFLEQVPSERELMRQLPLRLDWLWFCEMDLDDAAPDHSVLSKARRRWGLAVFESLFADVLSRCRHAGLIDGATVYADSTVLTANASVESRVARKLWEQLESGLGGQIGGDEGPAGEADDNAPGPGDAGPARPVPPQDTQAQDLPPAPTGPFNTATVSTTDPDAATTQRRGRGVTLGYRDHRLVDDRHGVVLATIATPAHYDDASLLPVLLDRQLADLHQTPRRAVGDSAYGTKANLEELAKRGVRPYLKARASKTDRRPWVERLAEGCDPQVARRLMGRRLHRAEGSFAEAHVRHGHRRCRWRRRWRVQIQCYLVAMVQNIRKLARYGGHRPTGAGVLSAIGPAVGSLAVPLLSAPPRRHPGSPMPI